MSNYRLQPNLLWQNDGTGKFTDVSAESGTAGDGDRGAWGHTIGSAWGDLDNDGHLRLDIRWPDGTRHEVDSQVDRAITVKR